ncbi:hypothetical protein [Donghicola eburneus]|uniref:Uncharacterized protein n=1 Tax=Donghicola eburneus TaxID=393278 RepID=A0A1M4N3W3_9RHOB|nr:hypothetical protein [Donghicola eburneus]SCM68625.1 hypothetical protein KARMA_2850 [Donghicola eburneus]SFQ28573.1 hypothetical protein SAMN05421764_102450 [Donghicola eburneus]
MSEAKQYYILQSKTYNAICALYLAAACAAYIFGITEAPIYDELTGGHFGTSSIALFLPLLVLNIGVIFFEFCRKRLLKKRGFTFENERSESSEFTLSPEELADAKARESHSKKVLLTLLGLIVFCLATIIYFAGGWKF